MPNAPISGLPAAGALSAADLTVLVQGGVTVQSTVGAAANFARSFAHPGYITGGTTYYPSSPRIGAGIDSTLAANSVNYTMMLIPRTVTIDQFGVRTGSTNATGSNMRMGIYSASGGKPVNRLVTINAAAAAIPATANTSVVVTPDAGTITLDPGFYFFALIFDATSQILGQPQDATNAFYLGTQNFPGAPMAGTSQGEGFTEASATLPAVATPVYQGNGVQALPSSYFRVA
jgi:hypothetical protein